MKTLTAKDIMSRNILTVPSDMNVHELAGFFTEKMISGAPVVNDAGTLLGVVSLADIVRNDERRVTIAGEAMASEYYLSGWEDELSSDDMQELHLEANADLTVAEIMTPLLFKVSEMQPISELADTMISGRIHRLLVTRDDKIVGIITTLDMLKAIREYTS